MLHRTAKSAQSANLDRRRWSPLLEFNAVAAALITRAANIVVVTLPRPREEVCGSTVQSDEDRHGVSLVAEVEAVPLSTFPYKRTSHA